MSKTTVMPTEASSDPSLWVDRYAEGLYRYAILRVREPEAAEELVQETFLAALSARKEFRAQSSERTWLIGILKHKIVDHFRRLARQDRFDNPQGVGNVLVDDFKKSGLWKVGPGKWPSNAEQVLQHREFQEVLRRCLSALPNGLARSFVLREMEGLDTKEICNVLQISQTNLWVTLHRARLSLRRCIELNWFG